VTDARQRGVRPPARAADASLLPRAVAPVALPALPEFDLAGRVRGECSASGLWFSAHPLDVLVDPAALRGTVPAAALERRVGRRVALAGMPCATRRVETRQGGAMLFLTLADRSGLAECVLFPDAYRALARAVRGQIVRVEGRVEETLGALSVTLGGATEILAGAPGSEDRRRDAGGLEAGGDARHVRC
jgi:DNA polymerase III alpha subunit